LPPQLGTLRRERNIEIVLEDRSLDAKDLSSDRELNIPYHTIYILFSPKIDVFTKHVATK